MTTRKSWDEFYLDIARAYRNQSTCSRDQIGAVVVKDKRIISAGFNGGPSGTPHCVDGGCPRGRMSKEECPPGSSYGNCIAWHAEVNALLFAGQAARGATLYVTREPCDWCAKVVEASGVDRVVVDCVT